MPTSSSWLFKSPLPGPSLFYNSTSGRNDSAVLLYFHLKWVTQARKDSRETQCKFVRLRQIRFILALIWDRAPGLCEWIIDEILLNRTLI